jgi:hypothetical protein
VKLVAHLQISIGEDGRMEIASLGYTLVERGTHKPIDNAEIQQLVSAFEASHGGSHVAESQQPIEVEHTGEVRPRRAADVVPGQAPQATAGAAAERLLLSLVNLGVDPAAAQAGLQGKGAQRVAEIAGWMTRKKNAEGLHAPTKLFEAMIAR